MPHSDFFDAYPADVQAQLEAYHALLLKWQKAINLVSRESLNEAWIRHFIDSAQIEPYVSRESLKIADIGSGAGFPGLVLAMLRPDLDVHLIESDERKCQFLKAVSRETQVDVSVHTSRIEDMDAGFVPDVVTARALADLTLLFDYIRPWFEASPALECVFLKGGRAEEEVVAAREQYDFEYVEHKSVTSAEARILRISNISLKSGV